MFQASHKDWCSIAFWVIEVHLFINITLTGFLKAVKSLRVMVLLTEAVTCVDKWDSSPITVFSPVKNWNPQSNIYTHLPTLEMSLNRSESENILVVRVLTIVSMCGSRIFLTNGARLLTQTSIYYIVIHNMDAHHLTARFCTSPFLSSTNFSMLCTTYAPCGMPLVPVRALKYLSFTVII